MNVDKTGIKSGLTGQSFTQGEKVMLRRLGDGKEYRAKIAGISTEVAEFKVMICEIVDPLPADYPFSHISIVESCIDKESW